MDFSKNDYQKVLDSYSIGKIVESYSCGTVKMKDTVLRRVLLRTNQGSFLLIYAHHDVVHEIWWSTSPERLEEMLMDGAGLVNAKAITLKDSNHFADHKFNHYFFVFGL